eukprot:COSAG05_NODE_12196_length_478_cov_1.617414_1_plen_61_part_01
MSELEHLLELVQLADQGLGGTDIAGTTTDSSSNNPVVASASSVAAARHIFETAHKLDEEAA